MTETTKQNKHELDFFCESLETRCMMAGDVSVRVRGGNLIVEGDDLENQIAIRQDGDLTIVERVSDTLINGAFSPFSTDELTRDIRIDLDGGDDLVFFGGGNLPRDIRFTGDADSEDSFVTNGSGSFRRFRGRSNGNLMVTFGDLTADRIDLRAAAGADVTIDNAVLTGRSSIRIFGGDADFEFSDSSLRELRFQNRDGDAKVLISDVSLSGNVNIATDDGDDLVDIRNSDLENLRLRMREGDDIVILFNTTMNRSAVRLDDGSDLGIYQEVTIARHDIDGGDGEDELTTLGNMGDFSTQDFETETTFFKITGVAFVDQNGNGVQELPNDFALTGRLQFLHEGGRIDSLLIDDVDGLFSDFVLAGANEVTFTTSFGSETTETTFNLNVTEDMFLPVAVPNIVESNRSD